jgi:hypothetical protein
MHGPGTQKRVLRGSSASLDDGRSSDVLPHLAQEVVERESFESLMRLESSLTLSSAMELATSRIRLAAGLSFPKKKFPGRETGQFLE